jgi:DNA invertase Pin-like site-specific DNA recombinase
MANVLARVAAYENEVRSERIVAGQQVARANGKCWGGSERGRRKTVSEDQVSIIRRLKSQGKPTGAIARSVKVSRPTVYAVLAPE